MIQDTSINRILFVSNAIFVYLTIPEMRTSQYSGHCDCPLVSGLVRFPTVCMCVQDIPARKLPN